MPPEAAVDEAPITIDVPGLKKSGSSLMADRMNEALKRSPLNLPPEPTQPLKTPSATSVPTADPQTPSNAAPPVTVSPAEAASKPGAIMADALTKTPEVRVAQVEEADPAFLKSDEAKKGWRELKGKKSALEKQISELQPKLTEYEKRIQEKELEISTLKAQPKPDPAEVEKLNKSLAEYKKIVETAAIEKDPAFEAHFNNRISGAITDAKLLVGPEHADRVDKALRIQDGQARRQALEEIGSDLTDSQRVQLYDADRELRSIQREKSERIQYAQSNYQQIMEQQAKAQQEASEQRKQKAESVMASTLEDQTNSEDTFGLLKPRDGDQNWNQAVDEVKQEARRLYNGGNEESKLAKAAVRAALYPHVIDAVKSLATKVKELQGQITQLTAASPSVRPSNTNGDDKPKKWSEQAAGLVQEATGRR